MADLPGPKMRIGKLAEEPIQIAAGGTFTLTTQDIVGDAGRASMTFARLPQVVKPGDKLFLNDGIIQLEVERVEGPDVHCRVLGGGELRSRKGLNLPGIDLGISAFTERDRECLRFALAHGVDAVSQSFVESAADIQAVREAARSFGGDPFVLAKIERSRALEHIDEILAAADGIMVARGDLGVEVPIEHIAILQKTLVRKAVRLGKPVIIATQMLESMTHSRQPTRAEATDVANAVLDGADCVMLSGRVGHGGFPVEAVATLARITAATEPHRAKVRRNPMIESYQSHRPGRRPRRWPRSSNTGWTPCPATWRSSRRAPAARPGCCRASSRRSGSSPPAAIAPFARASRLLRGLARRRGHRAGRLVEYQWMDANGVAARRAISWWPGRHPPTRTRAIGSSSCAWPAE